MGDSSRMPMDRFLGLFNYDEVESAGIEVVRQLGGLTKLWEVRVEGKNSKGSERGLTSLHFRGCDKSHGVWSVKCHALARRE